MDEVNREDSVSLLEKEKLLNVLEPDGPLSQLFDKYEYREAQVEMIRLIIDAFNENKVATIEAGTGVGKSLAYLIPSIEWAINNKEKVVISTATINLQQQIVEKDIPLAAKVLGVDINAMLVKGRNNYLCTRRLEEALADPTLFDDENDELKEIAKWAEKTKEGSLTELPFKPNPAVWSRVNSESDSCAAAKCSAENGCFFAKMKKRAMAADLLVVNHHLLFADLAYRLEGAGFDQAAVLPPFKKVVIDEAHNIENSATNFFSSEMSHFSVTRVLSRLMQRRGNRIRGLIVNLREFDLEKDALSNLSDSVESVKTELDKMDAYATALLDKEQSLRFKSGFLSENQNRLLDYIKMFHMRVSELYDRLGKICKAIPDIEKNSRVLNEAVLVLNRLEAIAQHCHQFISLDEHPESIFWIKKTRRSKSEYASVFVVTPLKVNYKLQQALFEPFETVVSTSATLTVGKRFDSFFKKVGINLIDDERIIYNSFPSPFPYRTNVLLQVPTDGPEPNHALYTEYVQRYIRRALEITEGKGLILFTSYKMLEEVYAYCLPYLEEQGITVFKQGDDERSRLLKGFKQDIASVLFATSSFWEGVDSPGETLSIVIITKLPFSVPTDPILCARMEAIESAGGNPFMEISVPDAVMKLKQGFGRLIRSHEDRGIVSILDGRLVRKQYGRIFFDSLPETAKSITTGRSLIQELENFLY